MPMPSEAEAAVDVPAFFPSELKAFVKVFLASGQTDIHAFGQKHFLRKCVRSAQPRLGPARQRFVARLTRGPRTVRQILLRAEGTRWARCASRPAVRSARALSVRCASRCAPAALAGPRLILLGAPASGKGRQSELLVSTFELTHISTGAVLREVLDPCPDIFCGRYATTVVYVMVVCYNARVT